MPNVLKRQVENMAEMKNLISMVKNSSQVAFFCRLMAFILNLNGVWLEFLEDGWERGRFGGWGSGVTVKMAWSGVGGGH